MKQFQYVQTLAKRYCMGCGKR